MMVPWSWFPLLAVSLLAVQTSSQYVDLFQGLQTLFQPYQYDGSFREVTTRRTETRKNGNRQSSKNTNPAIVFPDEIPRTSVSKPHTTSKPRKSRPNSSHTTTRRPNKSNLNTTPKYKNDNRKSYNADSIYFVDNDAPRRSQNRNPDVNNIKRVDPNTFTTNLGNRPSQNGYTTKRPIRPGVKPAPVDESRPPITNRPVENGFGVFETSTLAAQDEPELEIGPDEDDMTSQEKRQYMEIAEEMCEKYKALNVKKVVALPLVPSHQGVEFNVSDCTPINIPLIIGGTVSKIEEFPHMSLVGWKKVQSNGYSWKCGGSLISDQYVLTAGHCTYHDKDSNVASGPPHAVQLGSTYVDGPGAVVVKTSRVIRHPKYKQRRSYYDVALIQLVARVSFSEVIRPACLGVPPSVGRPIIATGWGRTEFGGTQSLELRSVSLPIWDMQDCKQVWGTSLKLPNGPSSESHVCAGEKSGGKDTCQGDSGGPAQIQDGCVWRVVAVTSSGRSCGAPDTPALYATIPRAFIAAQVFGKKALDNRLNNQITQNNRNHNNRDINKQNSWNSQSGYNQNNQNNYQNNRNSNNVNTQSGNYQNNQNSYQNHRETNNGNAQNWNSNQNTQNINQNQNNWNGNQNNQNNYQQNQWTQNADNYNRPTNSYQNQWNVNQNSNNPTNSYGNHNNRNQNTYQTTHSNQNNYNRQDVYQNNRDVYQTTHSNINQNNYNRQDLYQNNRNSYVTGGWNNPDSSGYDYFGVTERPWY